MNRFHVHLNVSDLDRSIRFYSQLFASEPAVVKGDYAKWMLEDPRVNFAISTTGRTPGMTSGNNGDSRSCSRSPMKKSSWRGLPTTVAG